MPAEQPAIVEHIAAPAADVVPAAQFVHAALPAAAYIPEAHIAHIADPLTPEKVPALHAAHAVDPTVATNVPNGHGAHDVWPEVALNIPTAHDKQLFPWNMPAAQLAGETQALAPASDDSPDAHDTHAEEAATPVTALYVPAGQATHLTDPAADWNVPTSHNVQPVWPVLALKLPAAHTAQIV